MTFGEYVRQLRLRGGLTLRTFCKRHGHDPGNWSKMERGLIPPPKDGEKLREYAEQLGIKYPSDEWYEFSDLASVASGIIPKDVLEDRELASSLPLFFRTIRGTKPREKDLKKLIEIIKGNP